MTTRGLQSRQPFVYFAVVSNNRPAGGIVTLSELATVLTSLLQRALWQRISIIMHYLSEPRVHRSINIYGY